MGADDWSLAAIAVAFAVWCLVAFAWGRWRRRVVAELRYIRRLLEAERRR